MTQVNFDLHPGQLSVYEDPARFKVVAAGRRWGKTRLLVVYLLTQGMLTEANGYDLRDKHLWYVAPTFPQGMDAAWQYFMTLGEPLIKQSWSHTGKFELVSGRFVQIKGSDRPDTLRGPGLGALGVDEYADMKPDVWEYILGPTLADVEGAAMFIGSPKKRNHFYELYLEAQMDPDWSAWTFPTLENPFISSREIEKQRGRMATEAFRQEFEASFDTEGATVLDPNLVDIIDKDDAPKDGHVYIAVDPAGYSDASKTPRTKLQRLDETAIAVVSVGHQGWTVLDLIHGRWDVRETSVRILRAAQRYRPLAVGIEKGALRNAILPYLDDQRRRLGISCQFVECTHGGNSKSSRIALALQGRLEHGRMKFVDGDYVAPLREQMFDFPGGRRDDMLDALAYIDQVSQTVYTPELYEDQWEPLDTAVGY